MDSEETAFIDTFKSEIENMDEYILHPDDKENLTFLLKNSTVFFTLLDKPVEFILVAKALLKLYITIADSSKGTDFQFTVDIIDILIKIAVCFMRLGYTDSATGLFEILKNVKGSKLTDIDIIGAYGTYLIQMCSMEKA
jgi:hypothetical protein